MTFRNVDIYKFDTGTDHKELSFPEYLNTCIYEGSSEWVLYCYGEDNSTSFQKQLSDMTGMMQISSDVIFSHVSKTETGASRRVVTEEIICNYDIEISVIMIRRSLFIRTGCFNEFLGTGCLLEFLYRASLYTEISYIPDLSCGNFDSSFGMNMMPDAVDALAYILCCEHINDSKNMSVLLKQLLTRLKEQGYSDIFMSMFNKFTREPDLFKRYRRNTAPIFIISGNDTCFGVLNGFSQELADTFARMGQAVITTDGQYAEYKGLEDIDGKILKCLIGFQAPVLFDKFFESFDSPKLQFWFDDPVFFGDMFDGIDDSVYILCQDAYHADYLRNEFGIVNAFQMPPGGRMPQTEPVYTGRDKDLVFIGTYIHPEEPGWDNDFCRKYYEYMISHPWLSYAQGIDGILKKEDIFIDHGSRISLTLSLIDTYRYVRDGFRSRIIDTITENGIKMHVYGDSWKNYEGIGSGNLIIHPELSPDEMIKELGKAKLSLNIMSWHKAGMTERIINSMLSGAVCISDETAYLKKNLSENEIIQYSLERSNLLPGMIRKLLKDENYRIRIAQNAFHYASSHETWDIRAKKILMRIKQYKKE